MTVTPVPRLAATPPATAARRPRIGVLGAGWIGRQRMRAVVESDIAEIVGVADPDPGCLEEAQITAPDARCVASLDELLQRGLDGIMIATPSALHAVHASAALERGIAVFCQKPLARTLAETQDVLAAARAADQLLGVDLSYRHTAGARAMRELATAGALGRIYAADLVFHNAYGPDKPWFRDPALAGGGCLIDLGTHLIDLALWLLDWPQVARASGRLFARGLPLEAQDEVEDYAVAELELTGGVIARIACSWNLHVGKDAAIEASFHGTEGGVSMRNVNGSFYDFVTDRLRATGRERLTEPPDAWGGRAAIEWARRLAAGELFDPAVERVASVASVIDRIYGR